MNQLTYIAPTERRAMTKQRRVRIFLSRNGKCWRCGVQIRAHVDRWIIEHPEALNLGGSDNDAELWPAHERCGIEKTKEDAAKIAKRNSIIDSGYAGRERGSGFRRPPGSKFNWSRGRYERPNP